MDIYHDILLAMVTRRGRKGTTALSLDPAEALDGFIKMPRTPKGAAREVRRWRERRFIDPLHIRRPVDGRRSRTPVAEAMPDGS